MKQAGWNPRAYRRMIMETAQQFEFERISRPLSEQPASGGAHRKSTRKGDGKEEICSTTTAGKESDTSSCAPHNRVVSVHKNC